MIVAGIGGGGGGCEYSCMSSRQRSTSVIIWFGRNTTRKSNCFVDSVALRHDTFLFKSTDFFHAST